MLHDAQSAVRDFHRLFGVASADTPSLPSEDALALRVRLIREEARECEVALADRDIVGIANELADLCYVALGTAIACGIDLSRVFEAVHAANMAKGIGGPRFRGDGKVLKPEGWRPADIATELKKQGWVA